LRLRYDPTVDVIYIRFREEKIAETDEISPGVMLDMAEDGSPVALEILNASKVMGRNDFIVEVEMARALEGKAV